MLLTVNEPVVQYIDTLQLKVTELGVCVEVAPSHFQLNVVPENTLPAVHDPGCQPPQVVVATDHVPPALFE